MQIGDVLVGVVAVVCLVPQYLIEDDVNRQDLYLIIRFCRMWFIVFPRCTLKRQKKLNKHEFYLFDDTLICLSLDNNFILYRLELE